MTVNVSDIKEQVSPITGCELYVAQAGIKKSNHNDLTVLSLAPESKVAGVFTQNKFCAAPVRICQERLTMGEDIRALVINTGNANAGTGQLGREHALVICEEVAAQFACKPEQVLPFSTGVIMEVLPVTKIIAALGHLTKTDWQTAAAAIMTTDTVAKIRSKKTELAGKVVQITGIAKGSGMIHPNMATLLSFVATDANISTQVLNQLIHEVVETGFNSITVDGDTSTNDSFMLIATGKAGNISVDSIESAEYKALKQALQEVVVELAKDIVRDGEGATKFISIEVNGAASYQEAKQVGYSIAYSPLVKTAFFASDANLGRILCAIGNTGIEDLNVEKVRLFLGDVLVAENGGVAASYQEEAGQSVMQQSEITVKVELNRGDETATVYTCDLSHEYVSINADYRS